MENEKVYTLITGASSGIGYAVAKAFAKRGKNLIVVARRKDNLERLQREVLEIQPSLDVVIRVCDLTKSEDVYQLYEGLQGYVIETLVNNAGFGDYASVAKGDLAKVASMLDLNVKALTILSSLYVRDYQDVENSQLINVSSGGGYTIVPNAVIYCASKFYVSAFTEGLAHELKVSKAKMQAKVLAPAATATEFGQVANGMADYDYDKVFGTYHTSEQMADFLLQLHDSNEVVGAVDRETFVFTLGEPVFSYAGNSKHNQRLEE